MKRSTFLKQDHLVGSSSMYQSPLSDLACGVINSGTNQIVSLHFSLFEIRVHSRSWNARLFLCDGQYIYEIRKQKLY